MNNEMRGNNQVQKMKNLKSERESVDVESPDSIFFSCHICGKRLAEALIVRPHVKMKTRMRAVCTCGETTFEEDFCGQFCLGSVDGSKIVSVNSEVDDSDYGDKYADYYCQNITLIIK